MGQTEIITVTDWPLDSTCAFVNNFAQVRVRYVNTETLTVFDDICNVKRDCSNMYVSVGMRTNLPGYETPQPYFVKKAFVTPNGDLYKIEFNKSFDTIRPMKLTAVAVPFDSRTINEINSSGGYAPRRNHVNC